MKKNTCNQRVSVMSMALNMLWALFFVSMTLFMTSSSAAAETPMDSSHSASIQKPVFSSNGTIVFGSKSIWKKAGWPSMLMCIDNDAICTLSEMFNFGKGDMNAIFFLDTEDKLEGTSSIFTASAREWTDSDKKLGPYKFSITLLDDGMVRVESTCILDAPSLLKSRYSSFEFPPYMALSGQYVKGENVISFDDKKSLTLSDDDLKDAEIKFFPDSGQKSFTIIPDGCAKIIINGNRISFFAANGGTMKFLLDIRGVQAAKDTSDLSPNGIDFFEIDKLRLPDYGASANLILNPSFEAGFQYWGYPCFAESIIPLKYQNFYALDNKESHSGSHSLRIKALPTRCPLPLGTFAIPFVSGKNYTLSFYAKGSCEKNLVVGLWGRELRHGDKFIRSIPPFAISNEWKRYSTPIVPDDRFGSIYFRAQLMAGVLDQQEESVWLDDIQLEEGDMTDFKQPVVSARLVSAARGNFLKFGQEPEFNLAVQSRPDANGTVSITVEDFFFRKIFEETYKFKTDNAGKSSINLDAMSGKILKDKLRGVFAVRGIFAVEGVERPFKDYFRFSVMDFLDNTHKNKNLFALFYVYTLQVGGPDTERFMERERAIGFGSFACDFGSFANDLDYALDKERMQLVEKYGIEPMGRGVLKLHNGVNGEISEENESLKMTNVKSRLNPTDEELAVFESICAVKAKNRSWNKIWWFTGESNPGCMPLEGNPDAFAKFLLATCRGIKRGNPEAKVLIEGGPWNMDSASGTKWVERYIQDTKRIDPNVRFDGAAAHHYRNFPENPDLDSDVAAFLAMLDRNGCEDWPFYINEGGNYVPFNIPQEGVSPYICHSANAWYFGPLSYHIGRAERIASAFSARNWLVALKYQNRVACMQDFAQPNRYMDFDFTPRVYDKIPNTLGRILGNASFYKDIRFAPYVRCYVFKEDKTGSPIAAIWCHKESVDRWKEEPPLYTFGFGGQDIKFIDLMENEVSYPKGIDGRIVIPMSPFPLFIKGVSGTEEQLCEAISKGTSALTESQNVQIEAFPDASGKAAVIFKNLVSKDLKADAEIIINGKEKKLPVQLASLSQKEETFDLEQSLEYGKVLPFDFTCSVNGVKTKEVAGKYILLADNSGKELNIMENPSAWESIPAIDMGDNVFLKTSILDGKFIGAIEIKGANLVPADVFAGIGLYVDPFAKIDQWYVSKKATEDLAVFEFVKNKDNVIEAFCHFVQGTQAGSGSSYLVSGGIQKRIIVKIFPGAESAFMIFSVPQEVLSPLIIKPQSRFGLNIAVPVNNGVKTLAPIENFKKAGEPGEINFVMVVVCDS